MNWCGATVLQKKPKCVLKLTILVPNGTWERQEKYQVVLEEMQHLAEDVSPIQRSA